MKIRKEVAFLFSEVGAKRWLNRPRLPRTNALFPLTYSDTPKPTPEYYAYSMDTRTLRMTEELADTCTREWPRDVLSSGFAGPSAVSGNFYALRNVSGYGMNPMPLPAMNNAKFVDSLGLARTIRPEDEPILREVIRLFFGTFVPADLHIRKKASAGFPYFTNDIQYRKMGTLKALRNINDFLKCVTGGVNDLVRARTDYHTLLIGSVNERQQHDSVEKTEEGTYITKERLGFSEAEARSGAVSSSHKADKTVRDANGSVVEGHFAMRRRTTFGYSGIPNYVLAAIMGCFRSVYLEKFAFTYKTRGPEDKEARISNYSYIVGSDVKNMDTTIPEWFFEFLLTELSKYWDDRLVLFLRRMLFAPYVVPPPWRETPDDYDPVFGLSPLDPKAFTQHVGLPSGIAINPDLGKLWMTFVYLVLFKDAGALHGAEQIESFLMGRNSQHALMDSSDDATLMTNSPSVRDFLTKAKSPYAVLEPEVPVIYLGDVFCEDSGRKRAYPNPLTYLVNAICREDSVDRIDPVDYSEGVLARFQQYARTPIFRDLNRVYEEATRKHFGVNPYLIARALAKRQRFTEVDALVKANPHYLHYRVDPATVSKEVLDEIVATIPSEDFFGYVKHLFKTRSVEATNENTRDVRTGISL